MILEEQSTSTYENLVYGRLLIAEREEDRRGHDHPRRDERGRVSFAAG